MVGYLGLDLRVTNSRVTERRRNRILLLHLPTISFSSLEMNYTDKQGLFSSGASLTPFA